MGSPAGPIRSGPEPTRGAKRVTPDRSDITNQVDAGGRGRILVAIPG